MRFLLIPILFLFSCTAYKMPEFQSFNNVDFKKSEKGMSLHFDATIRNPNPYRVVLKSGTLNVMLNNTKLGEVNINERMVLKAKSAETKEFELQAGFLNLFMLIPMMSDKSVLKVEGEVKGKAFIFSKKYKIFWEAPMGK